MVEDTSHGVSPVKSEAAGGGGLKGQTLLAKHRARQLEERCNLHLLCHAVPRQLDCRATNPLIVALQLIWTDAPLHPAEACRDDQGLTKRVRVPGRPSAAFRRFESYQASFRDAAIAVLAPGSNVTAAPPTRAGAGAAKSGSMRTVPVNQSAGPLPDAFEPARVISMVGFSFSAP
jgi:hypothetical protein